MSVSLLARYSVPIVLAVAIVDGGGTRGPVQPSNRLAGGPCGAEEFEGTGGPHPARWSYDVGGHGWGNNELQFYTEGRREHAGVESGLLVVEARREDWQGRSYTSARLNSRQGWQYGRVDVRARLPRGRGTWPGDLDAPGKRHS